MREEKEEIWLGNKQLVNEIREIQDYIKEKGETVAESEIVRACIHLAKNDCIAISDKTMRYL